MATFTGIQKNPTFGGGDLVTPGFVRVCRVFLSTAGPFKAAGVPFFGLKGNQPDASFLLRGEGGAPDSLPWFA